MNEWVKLIRVHQWAKNLILFLPLITAHRIFEKATLAPAVAGFFSFSILASATYIMNDLIDVVHDQKHPSKRFRPLAAGKIGLRSVKAAAIMFVLISISIAAFLPTGFRICLAIYLLTSLSYSLFVKKVPVADVTFLAGLFTLRLLAGHEAAQVKNSIWLLAFGIFFFFSLALVKRYTELQISIEKKQLAGRGYRPIDLPMVESLGIGSGLVSVLIVILYVNSAEVRVLYQRPSVLLFLAPILIYWIGRIWLLAGRGELHDDPVLFALRDRVSYLIGVTAVGIIMLSTF